MNYHIWKYSIAYFLVRNLESKFLDMLVVQNSTDVMNKKKKKKKKMSFSEANIWTSPSHLASKINPCCIYRVTLRGFI